MTKDIGRGNPALVNDAPAGHRPSGFDPARGDHYRCPAPPKLGGGIKPTEWLLSIAAMDEKKGATARAREARGIALWLTRLGRWMTEQAFVVPLAIAMEARQAGDACGFVHDSAAIAPEQST